MVHLGHDQRNILVHAMRGGVGKHGDSLVGQLLFELHGDI
jgi:hypothetical protein